MDFSNFAQNIWTLCKKKYHKIFIMFWPDKMLSKRSSVCSGGWVLFHYPVVPEPGGARGATGPPIFCRWVNPVRTREGRLNPPITTDPPNVFHLPASLLPVQLVWSTVVNLFSLWFTNDGRAKKTFREVKSNQYLSLCLKLWYLVREMTKMFDFSKVKSLTLFVHNLQYCVPLFSL